MTRKEAKEMLPIIQAYAEGKTIQIKKEGDWLEVGKNTEVYFSESPSDYRIKPEPKYRPFKTQEECWSEMHKHPDFGWIIYNKKYYSICDVTSNEITILYECDPCCLDFESCMEEVTFTDGTPFGIKEEQL